MQEYAFGYAYVTEVYASVLSPQRIPQKSAFHIVFHLGTLL